MASRRMPSHARSALVGRAAEVCFEVTAQGLVKTVQQW
jgi:hypothetical protein